MNPWRAKFEISFILITIGVAHIILCIPGIRITKQDVAVAITIRPYVSKN
jgi:hypothetical protein